MDCNCFDRQCLVFNLSLDSIFHSFKELCNTSVLQSNDPVTQWVSSLGAEKKYICTLSWRVRPVRAAITWKSYFLHSCTWPAQQLLRMNYSPKTRARTHTHTKRDLWHRDSPFLEMQPCLWRWWFLFLKEGTCSVIMTERKTSGGLRLSLPPANAITDPLQL